METEMKRILAALGVTGLALLGAAAPATAGDNSDDDHRTITICHATGSESNPYVELEVDFHAVKEHAWHDDDIIPGGRKWDGKNWDDDGRAIYYNGCVPCPPEVVTPEEPPVVPEEPPVVPEQPPVTPEQPPVTPEQPPVTPEQPPVVTPPMGAVIVQPPAAVAAVVVNNPGFNVQTAVASSDTVLAPWAAGLIVMLLAAAGVAARRLLPAGGVSRGRKD
jgi:hypothetical protein